MSKNDVDNDETLFYLESTASGTNSWWHNISSNPSYTFVFSGRSFGKWVDDMDEFEVFARKVRKERGIEDPPPKQKWVPATSNSSQVLYSGQIFVSNPTYHYQIKGIIDDVDTRRTDDNDG